MQNIIFYTLIKKSELTDFNRISIIRLISYKYWYYIFKKINKTRNLHISAKFFYLDLDFKNPVILVRSLQEHYSLHTISSFFLEKWDLAIANITFRTTECKKITDRFNSL